MTEARSEWNAYHRLSRTATYGFLSALPLLITYEILIAVANRGEIGQVRVGAEVWIKDLLALLGNAGHFALGAVVMAIGVAVFMAERKKRIPLRGKYFGWIVAESAVYAVVVALLVATLVGAIIAAAGQLEGASLSLQLALSIGAGVYEELVFRVILVGGLFWLLRRSFSRRRPAYVLAAVVGALLFSFVHYIGPLGDAFTVGSFLFRFLFGLALNVIFLLRGFGIAAWTHSLYDVMIVLGVFG